MSVKAMTWVFDHSPYQYGKRLVHLAIADIVNDDNDWLLWAAKSKLAAKAAVEVGTVASTMKLMCEEGYLELIERRPGHPTVYRFLCPTPSNIEGVAVPTPANIEGVPQSNIEGVPQQSAEPHLLPTQGELKGTQILRDVVSFETFWTTYPKRDGKRLYKPEAAAQWDKLTDDHKDAAFVGAKFYCEACDSGLNRAKDAYRWIRDHCWVDWQDPAVPDTVLAGRGRNGASFLIDKVREQYADQ